MPKQLDARRQGPTQPVIEVDTGVEPVDDDGDWHSVATIILGGSRSAMMLQVGNVGEKPFTHLMLTRAAIVGAKHLPWFVDDELDQPTVELTSATPNLCTLAPGTCGHVKLDHLLGVAEVTVWIQAKGTKARLAGTIA